MNSRDIALSPIPKKPSLVEDVIQELSNFILEGMIEGKLKLGDRLPSEREISDLLHVGRSTLREAMKVLTILGLLEARTGQGTFITDGSSDFYAAPLAWGLIIGEQSIAELIEARALLECEAASLAAVRATPEEREQLKQAFIDMQSAKERGDVQRFIDEDVRFHITLAKAAHNAVIFQTIKTIRRLLELWIQKVLVSAESLAETVEEHRTVVDAIRLHDAEQAKFAMQRHIGSATERLKNVTEWK